MHKLTALLFALTASMAVAPAVSAQQAMSDEMQSDSYAALYAAMQSGLDQEAISENMLDTVVGMISTNNPVFQGAEAEHPGVTAALRDALRPILVAYSDRVTQHYRPRMLGEIHAVFTPEEATALTRFYSSAAGRRLLQLLSGNMRADRMVGDYMAEGRVTADSVNRDVNEATMQSINQLTAGERAALVREAMATPGYAKLPILQERVAPIRAEMEATPMNGEEGSALLTALQKVAQDYALLPK